MIPKIIHYIWLGSKLPKKIQNLINANNEILKDYEIKIWTDENMPKLNKFAKQAYKDKKWAFVSDYLRYVILRDYGGIYLDTDMKVFKHFDDLLENNFFSGWNREKKYVYAGIIGTVKNHKYIIDIVTEYNLVEYNSYPTSPEIMTKVYHSYIKKEELYILDSNYFYPVNEGEKETAELIKDSYTSHLWFESWRKYVWVRRLLRRIGFMKIYHKYFI